jgi:hypothetical protein
MRMIKPGFFKNEELFDLELETGLPIRVAYAGLWTVCDKAGRFEWKPRTLKSDVLPFDDVDFSRVLDALATRRFVVRYEVDGMTLGYIPSWNKHQSPNNKEWESNLPAPPEGVSTEVLDACPTRAPRVAGIEPTSSLSVCMCVGMCECKKKDKSLVEDFILDGALGSTLPGLLIEDPKPLNEDFASGEEKPGTDLAVVKPRKEADPRHNKFHQILQEYWIQANPGIPELVWDGRDGKALKDFLSASPNLDERQFRGLLQNRARSDVAHGDRVYLWVGNLTRYQEPLDRYNRPRTALEGKNHEGTYAERKQQATIDSTRAVVEYFEARDRVGAFGN